MFSDLVTIFSPTTLMLVGDKRAFKAWGKMVKIKSLIILILRT
jgi:hypothetical protein